MLAEGANRLADVSLPQTGIYTVVLRYANDGSRDEDGLYSFDPGYTLRLTSSSAASGGQVQQTDLTIGTRAPGLLPDKAAWTFAGSAGQVITISVASSDFDSQLRLLSAEGDLLAEDDDGGEGMSAQITYTLPVTGLYTVEISSWNDKVGAYTLEVQDAS